MNQGVADPRLTAWLLRLIYMKNINSFNDSNGNRTRVTAVKGRCLNRLTMEPSFLNCPTSNLNTRYNIMFRPVWQEKNDYFLSLFSYLLFAQRFILQSVKFRHTFIHRSASQQLSHNQAGIPPLFQLHVRIGTKNIDIGLNPVV